MNREDGGAPNTVRQCCICGLDRRSGVIAMATAVMMRIPFITIGGDLIGVAWHMAHRDFVHTCLMR